MVFKADFVEDMGGPKEVAAVDPKMAYYLGDTLKQVGASTGKIAEAVADGVIGVDAAYQTNKLATDMKDTLNLLEQGDIAKTKAVEEEKAAFDWEKASLLEKNPQASQAELDSLTSKFEQRMKAIDASFTQKGISYTEATYRWNRALQQAIAARPSLANEFRQISGKWTGSGDWDHLYIKKEAAQFEAQQQEAIAAAKKSAETQAQFAKDNVKYYVDKIGASPETVLRLQGSEEGRQFLAAQEQLLMASTAAKNEAERLKNNGTLTEENFQKVFNTSIGEATYTSLGRHSAMLATDKGPLAKYNKDGKFDYTAASADPDAMLWLKGSIEQDINNTVKAQRAMIAGMLQGTSADPTKFYKQLDDWAKNTVESLTKSPTAALDYIKAMRENKSKNFQEAMVVANAATNTFKNLGITGEDVHEYNRMGKDVYAKTYGKADADRVERFMQFNNKVQGFVNDYAVQYGITQQEIATGAPSAKPAMEMTPEQRQAAADAQMAAKRNTLIALNKGMVDGNDSKAYNTVLSTVKKVVPIGADWDGPEGIMKSITNGNFAKYLTSLPLEKSVETRGHMTAGITDFLKNYTTTTTGQAVISRSLGGKDWPTKYVLTPVATPEDVNGISVPKYSVSLTPQAVEELRSQRIGASALAGPGATMLGDKATKGWDDESQRKIVEDRLNRDLALEFNKPYTTGTSALTIIGNVPIPTKQGATGTTRPVPKNATIEKWW